MSSCTFFGHHDCPESVREPLREALIDLIEHQGVLSFYVGNQGNFDRLALLCLRELQKTQYPRIRYSVVLAYLPQESTEENTSFPEGLETVPRRFAIVHRNRWMLSKADFVVTYITRSWGGAAVFAKQAERKGKRVIPLRTS